MRQVATTHGFEASWQAVVKCHGGISLPPTKENTANDVENTEQLCFPHEVRGKVDSPSYVVANPTHGILLLRRGSN